MEELLKNQIFAIHALSGVGSVALGTALTYPLDTIKTLIQVGSGSSKQLTTTQVLKRVRYFSGNSGLYNGFLWLAAGRTLGLEACFGTYEILTAFYKDGREDNYVYVSEALLAGLVAGVAESLISSPLELTKLRAQVVGSHPQCSVSGNHLKSSLWKDGVHYGEVYGQELFEIQFLVAYSFLLGNLCTVQCLTGRQWGWILNPANLLSHRSDDEIGPLSPLAVSIAAGISGSVAAAASHCFDTAKSRSECTVLPKYGSTERKLLKWGRPGNRFERVTGIHPSDRNLLFRSLGLGMARSGIASFVMVGSYFLAADLLV